MKKRTLLTAVLVAALAFIFVQTTTAQQQQQYQQQGQFQMNVQRASKIMDEKVVDREGKNIGSVEDIVFSDRGQPLYLVLKPKNIQGVQDNQLIPIPWNSVTINTQQREITAQVSKNELQNAPAFSQNNWNQLGQSSFENNVFGYYGGQQRGYYGQGMQQRGMMGYPYQQQRGYQGGQGMGYGPGYYGR